MAGALPRFIVLKSRSSGLCAYYTNRENDVFTGYIRCDEKNVSSPYAKIEVEPSKSTKYSSCFHLRFCYSNRYFGLDPTKDDDSVVARSNQPVEDPYERSCTLLYANIGEDGRLELRFVSNVLSGHSSRVNTEEGRYKKFIIVGGNGTTSLMSIGNRSLSWLSTWRSKETTGCSSESTGKEAYLKFDSGEGGGVRGPTHR